MDESGALITPAEEQLKSSEPYVEGLKAITQADQGKLLSLQEYTSARDLLAIFALDNATRPGPLNNAKLKDYETTKTENRNKSLWLPAISYPRSLPSWERHQSCRGLWQSTSTR